MAKKITKAEAKKHIVDVVTNLHSTSRESMVRDLEKLGMFRHDAHDIISDLIYEDKILRSNGSDLRPAKMSKEPHLEINDMTGWWAIYIDGEYQVQRESKSEAELVMKQLVKK